MKRHRRFPVVSVLEARALTSEPDEAIFLAVLMQEVFLGALTWALELPEEFSERDLEALKRRLARDARGRAKVVDRVVKRVELAAFANATDRPEVVRALLKLAESLNEEPEA